MGHVDHLIASLDALVSMPTESRTPNVALLEYVAERLGARGAEVRIVSGPDSDRSNLIASIGPTSPGGVLFSGHTDVVPAGTGWITDPYSLTDVGDGRLAGRGTADMKGFIAALLVALDTLGAELASMTRPIHVALSFDEELGCAGVPHLFADLAERAEHGHQPPAPDIVVIGEPTMMRPRVSHLGKRAWSIELDCDGGHSSRSASHPGAVMHAIGILGALDATVGAALAGSPSDDAEPRLTMNPGRISGGTGLNVIADHCRAECELRFSAEFDPDVVLQPFWTGLEQRRQRFAREGNGAIRVEEVTRYPALATDASLPAVRLIERVADAGTCTSLGFGTEGGLFAAALGAPVVICGPGDIGVAHRAGEWIAVDQLSRAERFVAQTIRAFCVEPVA